MHERANVLTLLKLIFVLAIGCVVFMLCNGQNVYSKMYSYGESTSTQTTLTSAKTDFHQQTTNTTTFKTTCITTTQTITEVETTEELTSTGTEEKYDEQKETQKQIVECTDEEIIEDTVEEYYDDAIIIKDKSIPIICAYVTQELVDAYDVVYDTERFSFGETHYLFGHVTKSFEILKNVEVGEIIKLRICGNEISYRVNHSEIGEAVDNGYDIVLQSDETRIVENQFTEDTIVLITCTENHARNFRWIVIATIE